MVRPHNSYSGRHHLRLKRTLWWRTRYGMGEVSILPGCECNRDFSTTMRFRLPSRDGVPKTFDPKHYRWQQRNLQRPERTAVHQNSQPEAAIYESGNAEIQHFEKESNYCQTDDQNRVRIARQERPESWKFLADPDQLHRQESTERYVTNADPDQSSPVSSEFRFFQHCANRMLSHCSLASYLRAL
jgi:hypothetical protein